MAREQCVLSDCTRIASFYIGWEEYGIKRYGEVCATHDRTIGRENLAEWKPWMSSQKVVDWDNRFCRQPDWVGLEQYIYAIDPAWDR